MIKEILKYFNYLYIPVVLCLLYTVITLLRSLMKLGNSAKYINDKADQITVNLNKIQKKSEYVADVTKHKLLPIAVIATVPFLLKDLFSKKKPLVQKAVTVSKIVGGFRRF